MISNPSLTVGQWLNILSRNTISIGQKSYQFKGLADLLAKASAPKSGDNLAGIAAENDQQRVAAQLLLAETPVKRFLEEPLIPYSSDAVTRLLFDEHDSDAFRWIEHDTLGELRNRLLD